MEAVDLGLSVKWADCNIGANKPEEYGNYYAWGEIEPKDYYDWSTYKYGSYYNELTKYCTNSYYGNFGKEGFIDNKTVLEPDDDVAIQILGDKWRMPTDKEWTELREKCTWLWATRNGIRGREIKSKINGNSIFLPSSGYRDSNSLYINGYYASYWSSSLDTDYPIATWGITIFSDDVRRYDHFRYYGLPVRPVLSNN